MTKKKLSIVIIFLLILLGNVSNLTTSEDKFSKNYKIDNFSEKVTIKASGYPLVWSYLTGGMVISVAISDDGKYIVAGGPNGKVYLINGTNSNLIWSLSTGLQPVNSVDISSDGNYIVIGSDNIYVFESSNPTPLWAYGTGGSPHLVAISDDGNYIIGTCGKDLRFFQRSSSTPIWSYIGIAGLYDYFFSVGISSDGTYCVAGRDDTGEIFAFNNTSSGNKQPLWSYNTGADLRTDSVISSDGRYACVGNGDPQLTLYTFNITNPQTPLLWSYSNGEDEAEAVAISSDGQTIAVAFDEDISVFNKSASQDTWNRIWSFYNLHGAYDIKISGNGNFITSCDNNGDIYLFNKSKSQPIWKYTALDEARIVDISFNGQYIVVGTDSGDKRIYFLYGQYSPSQFYLITDADSPDSDGSFNLNWTNSHGAVNYSVYVHDKFITEINETVIKLDSGITNLYYYISGIGNGKSYYKILAVNTYGNISSNCISVEVTIPPGMFLLSSDADSPDRDGDYNLTWSEAFEARNYSVYVASSFINNINDATLRQDGIEILNYSITNRLSDEYYYVVIAFNEYGNTSSNCIQIIVKIPPGIFNLNSDAEDPEVIGKFNLTWTESKGADNYSVYQSESFITQIDGSQALLDIGITDLNYTISTYKGIWYYMVVAYNETGNTSSNCISVDVRVPPKSFTLNSDADPIDTDGTFNLQWEESLGAENYSVYTSYEYITQIEMCTLLWEGLTSLTFLQSNLATDDYYYIIVALNDYGNISSTIIKVVVHRFPAAFDLSSMADSPDSNGAFYLNWTSSTDADNYSIYISNQFITTINEYIELICSSLTNYSLWISGLSTGKYYFIAVANNSVGYTLSNCILIEVSIPVNTNGGEGDGGGGGNGGGTTISFGYHYLIFTLITCISLIFLTKKKLGFKQMN